MNNYNFKNLLGDFSDYFKSFIQNEINQEKVNVYVKFNLNGREHLCSVTGCGLEIDDVFEGPPGKPDRVMLTINDSYLQPSVDLGNQLSPPRDKPFEEYIIGKAINKIVKTHDGHSIAFILDGKEKIDFAYPDKFKHWFIEHESQCYKFYDKILKKVVDLEFKHEPVEHKDEEGNILFEYDEYVITYELTTEDNEVHLLKMGYAYYD